MIMMGQRRSRRMITKRKVIASEVGNGRVEKKDALLLEGEPLEKLRACDEFCFDHAYTHYTYIHRYPTLGRGPLRKLNLKPLPAHRDH